MIRFQIRLDEPTYEELRRLAHNRHTSISSVARDILREHLMVKEPVDYTKLSFIGMGSSKEGDISERHDDYLAEDFL